jgi:YTH domain-containing protein 1
MDQMEDEQRKITEELQQAGYDTRSEASNENDSSDDSSSSISSVSSKSSRKKSHRNSKNNGKTSKDKHEKGTEVKENTENGKKTVRASSSKSPEPKKRRKNSTTSNKSNNNSSDEAKDSAKDSGGDGKTEKKSSKSYDYMTKLNYLFRETKFFVIKSNNAENVRISKTKSVWSTLPQNEQNLNQAYKECRNVLLIFSVKVSGLGFCPYRNNKIFLFDHPGEWKVCWLCTNGW